MKRECIWFRGNICPSVCVREKKREEKKAHRVNKKKKKYRIDIETNWDWIRRVLYHLKITLFRSKSIVEKLVWNKKNEIATYHCTVHTDFLAQSVVDIDTLRIFQMTEQIEIDQWKEKKNAQWLRQYETLENLIYNWFKRMKFYTNSNR